MQKIHPSFKVITQSTDHVTPVRKVNFLESGIKPPKAFQSDSFKVRPIRETDASLDYQAVMESRDYLRLWEQSTWPEDDFTVEANREDLASLEQKQQKGDAYTYTVMDMAETVCFGCVYIFPVSAPMFVRSEITALSEADWSDQSAAVYFWVRRSQLARSLDRDLLGKLERWLSGSTGFAQHIFVTNEQFAQQVDLLEGSGLTRKFTISDPKAEGKFLAFGRV